jgi:hypothetical protein
MADGKAIYTRWTPRRFVARLIFLYITLIAVFFLILFSGRSLTPFLVTYDGPLSFIAITLLYFYEIFDILIVFPILPLLGFNKLSFAIAGSTEISPIILQLVSVFVYSLLVTLWIYRPKRVK